MVKGGDIIALGKALTEATERIAKSLPVGVTLSNMQNQPKAVADSVSDSSRC
jgi:multidrug efflux pump subunit AcrB